MSCCLRPSRPFLAATAALMLAALTSAGCASIHRKHDPTARAIAPVSVADMSGVGVVVPATVTPFSRSGWITTGHENFDLHTDLPPGRAIEVGARYQTIRAALMRWIGRDLRGTPRSSRKTFNLSVDQPTG